MDITLRSKQSFFRYISIIDCYLFVPSVEPRGLSRGWSVQISQEARSIFEATWDKLVALFGEENLQVPKEIVWLNGAPGAGAYPGAENDFCELTWLGRHACQATFSFLPVFSS